MHLFIQSLKTDLKMQWRNKNFITILILTLGINILLLPSRKADYSAIVVYGYSGVYNSEYIAVSTAILTNFFLSLFGFYILLGGIKKDYDTGVGEIIATTPISKFQYILTRFLGYCLVLFSIDFVIIVSGIFFQVFQGESNGVNPLVFVETHAIMVWPVIALISSLTILIEILFIFKLGHTNILYFFLWMMSLIAIETIDWLGITTFENYVSANYVPLDDEFSLLGPKPDYLTIVEYPGLDITVELLLTKMYLLGIAFGMLVISSIIFNRFKANSSQSPSRNDNGTSVKIENVISILPIYQEVNLTPIIKERGLKQYTILLKSELKIILRMPRRKWFFTGMIYLIALNSPGYKITMGITLLLPILIWAELPNRDRKSNTLQLIIASPKGVQKAFKVRFMAGMLIALGMSSGSAIQFIYHEGFISLIAWILSSIFIVGLAFFLGSTSNSDKPFIIFYLLLWYFGSLNDTPPINYTFTSSGMLTIPYFVSYGILSAIFIVTSYILQSRNK